MSYDVSGNAVKLLGQRVKLRAKYFTIIMKHITGANLKRTWKRYKQEYGKFPDLSAPTTYSEKVLYLKFHYRNSLETLVADKYASKEYVAACGYPEIVRKFYAVYDDAKKINFDKLPEEFFIRCNHMSGYNFIVNKRTVNKEHLKKLSNILLRWQYYYNSREWPYKNIQRRIICEEVLKNKDGSPLADYKFYCFSGKPKYFMVSYGEYEHRVKNHKFNMDFESIDHHFKPAESISKDKIEIPKNFDKMVEIVSKLCKPFPHVRVDLYNIDGRIVFGEMTFFSSGGVISVYSKEFDKEIASWINLAQYRLDMI